MKRPKKKTSVATRARNEPEPQSPAIAPPPPLANREPRVSGSKKSRFPARFDLISTIGLQRLAETYGEGSLKYAANSWLKGFKSSDLINHAQAHLNEWRRRESNRGQPIDRRPADSEEQTDDHLAHAVWGLFCLMHFEETRPDLNDLGVDMPENQHA